MTLEIYCKNVYGNELIYPANTIAHQFCDLLGCKTFNSHQIESIIEMGFEFKQVFAPNQAVKGSSND
jgi:hypothetical protein